MPYCEKHNIENRCTKCSVEKREKTMMERYGNTS